MVDSSVAVPLLQGVGVENGQKANFAYWHQLPLIQSWTGWNCLKRGSGLAVGKRVVRQSAS